MQPIPRLIFASRWLQLPLYLGLIVAQIVYVYLFLKELCHLVLHAAHLNDLQAMLIVLGLIDVGKQRPETGPCTRALYAAGGAASLPGARPMVAQTSPAFILLFPHSLLPPVMISNLLIMVLVGGYETFVSRMGLNRHPDQPEWLSHVNASVLKIKLAMCVKGKGYQGASL
jgi:uncharacterized membrane protein YqhA